MGGKERNKEIEGDRDEKIEEGGAQRGKQIGGMEEDKGMKESKCRWVNNEQTGRETEGTRISAEIGNYFANREAVTKIRWKGLMNEEAKSASSPRLATALSKSVVQLLGRQKMRLED